MKDDADFISQVRGRTALLKFLGRISSSKDVLTGARACLSQRQIAELVWEVPCAECGALPEGAVTRMGHEGVEFRCPKGKCKESKFRGRTILLDPVLVEEVMSLSRKNLSDALQDALTQYRKGPSKAVITESTGKRPFTVRIPLSQHYFFSDQDIEAALVAITRGSEDE